MMNFNNYRIFGEINSPLTRVKNIVIIQEFTLESHKGDYHKINLKQLFGMEHK